MANLPSDYLTINTAENTDTSPAPTGEMQLAYNFTPSGAVQATGARFYATRALPAVTARLYDRDAGTQVATSATVAAVQGWNSLPFTASATLTGGTVYQVLVNQTPDQDVDNHVYYTATAGLASLTLGPITTGTDPGRYRYDTFDTLPGGIGDGTSGIQGSSASWYGMDLVTGTAPSIGGTITAVLATATAAAHPADLAGSGQNATLTGALATATAAARGAGFAASTRVTGDTPTATARAYPATLTGTTTTSDATLTGALATATGQAHPAILAGHTYTPATDPTGTVTAPDLHTEVTVGTLTTGDYGYPIGGQCLDGDQPKDCTGTTGELHVRRTDGTVLISDVTWTDPATGEWSYTLREGDLTVPGAYSLEIQVSVGDTVVQTFPGGTLQVREQYDT